MKKAMIAFLALAFILAVVRPALAEDPAAMAAQDQRTEQKNLRKEIVKLKYVRAQDIESFLHVYVGRDGRIMGNANMPSILTVSDTPENVEKILAAIRELDIKPTDVLYTVQLVLGSESESWTDPDLQNDPIIKELRKLLRFKAYKLLDSTLLRTVNRRDAMITFGPKAEFELYLRPDVAGDARAAAIETRVRLRQIVRGAAPQTETMKAAAPVVTSLIESTLNTKSGDRTVVGVSKLDGGGQGLILIISGKVID